MVLPSGPRKRSNPQPAAGLTAQAVLDALAEGGWQTRQQLSAVTGLASRSVDRIVHRLVSDGTLEAGRPLAGSGRPAVPIRLARAERFVGTVALRQDSVSSAVIDQDGSLLGLVRDPRPWNQITDIAAFCAQMLSRSVTRLHRSVSLDSVVLGFPLPYRQHVGHVSLQRDRPVVQEWMGHDLATELSQLLALRVEVENTCRLAALAEHRFGAARGCDDVIYLQLVGGSNTGVIAAGRVLRGVGGYAGEISHLQIDPDGPRCRCGARGCLGVCIQNSDRLIETWRDALPEATDVYEVLNLAAQGDPRLRGLLHELGEFMGEHLAGGCIMLNPERIVIDGSLGLAVAPVVTGVIQGLRRRLPDRVFEGLTVVPGRLGAEAALIGAAAFDTMAAS